jgi:hypothetical protein
MKCHMSTSTVSKLRRPNMTTSIVEQTCSTRTDTRSDEQDMSRVSLYSRHHAILRIRSRTSESSLFEHIVFQGRTSVGSSADEILANFCLRFVSSSCKSINRLYSVIRRNASNSWQRKSRISAIHVITYTRKCDKIIAIVSFMIFVRASAVISSVPICLHVASTFRP